MNPSTSAGRVMTLLANSTAKTITTSSSAQKTILLVQAVNNKSGGIQSLLLPSGVRALSSSASKISEVSSKRTNATVSVSSLLPLSMRSAQSRLADCISTPARSSGVRVMSMPSGSSQQIGSTIVKVSSSMGAPSSTAALMSNTDYQTPYALTFKSRTIQADGTVIALKEFLCNFCQFKVDNAADMEQHFTTHLFSCNYCSFRCTSRLDALCHKRDTHSAAAEELAGYEDLSQPSLVAKVNKVCRVPSLIMSNNSLVPPPAVKSIVRSAGSLLNSVSVANLSSGSVVTTMATSSAKMSSNTHSKSSVVMRSTTGKPGDSYFTYRIVHDVDGKVQAYECDVCAYQSVRISDIFAHASTHSLAELTKSCSTGSGTDQVMWECFYCSFVASLQVAVVSHVISSHPNKPIQLKRLPSTGDVEQAPFASGSLSSSLLALNKSDSQTTVKANGQTEKTPTAWSDRHAVELDKKKKTEVDDKCIWGCYYCSMTSPSRTDIICHLKKVHPNEKLVVTRRRLARMDNADAAPVNDVKSVTKETPEKTIEKALPAVVSTGKSDSKSRKKRLAEDSVADVQIGDIDSTDAHQGSAKSRRKQVAPRKVAEDAVDLPNSVDEAAGSSLPSADNGSAHVSVATQDLKTVSTGRKQGRSVSKYDGLIKKLKMADSEQHGDTFSTSLVDKASRYSLDSVMPELQKNTSTGKGAALSESHKNSSLKLPCSPASEVHKLSKSSASSGTKALSLLTGQLVSGYVKPPSTLLNPNSDLDMPVLQREDKSSRENALKTGLKLGVVKVVNVACSNKRSEMLQNFVFDASANAARCGVCGSSTQGNKALQLIRQHVAEHYNECKWACSYCHFQCNQSVNMVKHVRRRHMNMPLRMVRRLPCAKSSPTSKSAVLPVCDGDVKLPTPESENNTRKVRGPRSRREEKLAKITDVVWQCPFCSRRSVFQGFIKVHIKLAHADLDISMPPQKWTLNRVSSEELKTDIKTGFVSVSRVEDVDECNEVIESNEKDLNYELDCDDDDSMNSSTPVSDNADLLEFRCLQCHFRGANPAVVKCHILLSHPDDDVTMLDMRACRRINHEHVYMCKSVECQFLSTVLSQFDSHVQHKPSHANNKLINLQQLVHNNNKNCAKPNQSPETRSRTRISNKAAAALAGCESSVRRSQLDQHKSNAAKAVNGPSAVRELASRSRRTAEGDVDYNDDGTIHGVDLTTDSFGACCLQCQHCECRYTDLSDMKVHLFNDHARLEPLAIDVNAAIAGRHSWLFFCALNSCDFVASYFNVYKHHMDVEHPDSEIGFTSKSRSAKRRSLPGTDDRRASSSSSRDVRSASRRSLNVANDRDVVSPSRSIVMDTVSKSASNRPYKSSKDKCQFDFACRYECVLCSLAVATLADMKTHLLAAHDSSVVHQCIDRRARQLRKRQKILFCPHSNCSFCCKFDDDLERHVENEHANESVVAVTAVSKDSSSVKISCSVTDSCVYQCSHCTFITTDLVSVRQHVTSEHASSDPGVGFAEIKTALGNDGNIVMNVNDVAMLSEDSSSQDNSDSVKVGDER